MTELDVAIEVGGLVFRLAHQMDTYFESVVADFDLTQPQGRVLMELTEPQPMRALAERLDCDASNITGIVDRLERRGLVERRTAPDDRRVKLVALSDRGRRLRRRLEARFATERPSIAGLSRADQVSLRDLLRRALEVR